MAIRGPHAQHESRRPLVALGCALAGAVAILIALFLHGDVYGWSNGSSVGLFMAMGAIWFCAIGSFVSFAMALGRGHRVSRPATAASERDRASTSEAGEPRKAA